MNKKKELRERRRKGGRSAISKCPLCNIELECNIDNLYFHYVEFHGRKPSEAEFHRFRTYSKNQDREPTADWSISNPREVSGGSVSPR